MLSKPIFSIKKISKRISDVPFASISGKTIRGSPVQRSYQVTVSPTGGNRATVGLDAASWNTKTEKCNTSVTVAKIRTIECFASPWLNDFWGRRSRRAAPLLFLYRRRRQLASHVYVGWE
jgi:hypothetical protein